MAASMAQAPDHAILMASAQHFRKAQVQQPDDNAFMATACSETADRAFHGFAARAPELALCGQFHERGNGQILFATLSAGPLGLLT
jgi:hypothetical protein